MPIWASSPFTAWILDFEVWWDSGPCSSHISMPMSPFFAQASFLCFFFPKVALLTEPHTFSLSFVTLSEWRHLTCQKRIHKNGQRTHIKRVNTYCLFSTWVYGNKTQAIEKFQTWKCHKVPGKESGRRRWGDRDTILMKIYCPRL